MSNEPAPSAPGTGADMLAILSQSRRVLTQAWTRHPHFSAIVILGMLAAILFGQGLVAPDLVASDAGKDIYTFFYHRYWLARQFLLNGELLTWNPYLHCGTPATGTFQYAFWYPPHWLGAALPVSLLINWMFFLHTWLAGAAMYGWNRFHGRRTGGALTAGVIYMLCGPLLAKVPVGNASPLYIMALAPLVFWGIDGWLRHGQRRWLALATGAVALQLCAGYPPVAIYSALGAGGYALLELARLWFAKREHWLKLTLGLLAVYPLALMLTAVEWLPGVMLLPETTRNGALSGNFAIIGAISPEQLALLVTPKLFGGFGEMIWWGNEHFYQAVAYCGSGGLLLALAGWLVLPGAQRWRFAVLLLTPLIVSLGVNLPWFNLLNEVLPLFSRMRLIGRIVFLFALFLAPLAAIGFDHLTARRSRSARGIGLVAAAAGALLLTVSLALCGGWLDETFRSLVERVVTHPGYAFAQNRHSAQWWLQARDCAMWGLVGGGVWLLWFGGVVGLTGVSGGQRCLCALLLASVTVEMLWFAKPLIRYYPRAQMDYPALMKFAGEHPGEWRDLNLVNRSADMQLKLEGLWGYEALMLKRHAELMAFSQGLAPELGNEDMPQFRQNSRLFQLLRGRYLFLPTVSGIQISALQNDPLPRFLVVPKYRVLADRDDILRILSAADFDFRREVILENAPGFLSPLAAADTPAFSVKVLSSSASKWQVEVTTSAPGILLMTDSYAQGWHATALNGSAQSSYALQPADWAVRGIPLTVAGTHFIEIKYTPPGFALGASITALTLAALLMSLVKWLMAGSERSRRTRDQMTSASR
ncbi:MAG: YfhO family protein [Verrucomicrobiales bacterium]|jgi:hypothetical protein|nr:YfhO family protein [Verrucomicrobiales bacterium]